MKERIDELAHYIETNKLVKNNGYLDILKVMNSISKALVENDYMYAETPRKIKQIMKSIH